MPSRSRIASRKPDRSLLAAASSLALLQHQKRQSPTHETTKARCRILRIMQKNQLLSPYRCRKATGPKHTGTIITEAPNVMWGTDGTRILTVDDGYVWLFSAVEH